MILISRLPILYAVLIFGISLVSYPLFQNDLTPPRATTTITPGAVSPADQKQEQQKLVAFIAKKYSKSPATVSKIVAETTTQARSKGIDPLLFLALIGVESSFNPNAISHAGAVGLSQVLPRAHPEKMRRAQKAGGSASDIRQNIQMGVSILSEYRKLHKGNMRLALLRYNGSLKDPHGRYAAKVMAAHANLERVVERKPMRAMLDG